MDKRTEKIKDGILKLSYTDEQIKSHMIDCEINGYHKTASIILQMLEAYEGIRNEQL